MVIALMSLKGGLGKSLTAIYLSRILAMRGHKVVALDIDLGQQTLCDFASALPGTLVMAANPRDLKATIKAQCKDFNFVIIDCGFGISETTLPALEIADLVLVPCIPDSFEMKSTRKFLDLLWHAKGDNETGLKFNPAIVLTRVKNSVAHESAVEAAHTFSQGLVWNTVIPQRPEFERANKKGTTLLDMMPESKGALAYEALATELENYVTTEI